jgi:hypothetical protein
VGEEVGAQRHPDSQGARRDRGAGDPSPRPADVGLRGIASR